MGIQGLLPFLKKIHQQVNVSQFAGCTVAVDVYCWLHKGAFSCAEKLARGEKTEQYVYYCMKFVDLLLKANVKPVMVFDGAHLKSKARVEGERRERREAMRKKAAHFLREGKRNEAVQCMQASVDVTPAMARCLMDACQQRGVDCIVAPYEADAQIAFLNQRGIAQFVITEDSDLLTFGCNKVLFKMDQQGNGLLIESSRLNEVLGFDSGFYTFDKFRHMCILSGCDYLPRFKGVGLSSAYKVFRVARQTDLRQLLKKLSIYLKKDVTVTDKYIDEFIQAENTFLYQIVFDPLTRTLCPLNPYPPEINEDELHYAGQYKPPQQAYQIALGNLGFYKHEVVGDFDPETHVPKSKLSPKYYHELSIWNPDYMVKGTGEDACKELPHIQNLKGKEKTISIPQIGLGKRIRDTSNLPESQRPNPKKQKTSEVTGLDDNALMELVEKELIDETVQTNDFDDITAKENNSPKASNFDDDDCDDKEDIEKKKHLFDMSPKKKKVKSPSKVSAATIGDDTFHETSVTSPVRSQSKDQLKHNKNVFAFSADGAKSKFNLNATVPKTEVRSRFFAYTEHKSPKKSPRQSVSPLARKTKTPESANNSIKQLFANIETKVHKDFTSPLINIKQTPKSSIERGSIKKQPLSSLSAFSWTKKSQLHERQPSKYLSDDSTSEGLCRSTESVDTNGDCTDEKDHVINVEEILLTGDGDKTLSSGYFKKSPSLTLNNDTVKKEQIKKCIQTSKSTTGSFSLSKYFSKFSNANLSQSQSQPSSQTSSQRSYTSSQLSQNTLTPTTKEDDSPETDNDVITMSECGYEDFCKSIANSGENKDDIDPKLEGSSQLSVSSNLSGSSVGRVSLGSVDSFCRPSTQELLDLTLEGGDQSPNEVKNDQRNSSPNIVKKQACRAPGLSQAKPNKKKLSLKSSVKNQPTLTSLSRFAFTKSKMAK